MTFYDYIPTDWGIVGLSWHHNVLVSLELPGFEESELRLLFAAKLSCDDCKTLTRRPISDSGVAELSSLPRRLQEYFSGLRVDFADVPVEEHGGPFQRRVRVVLRSIGYGDAVSYGELAAMAGSPEACRAVGQTMATNRLPIIVPCHRVLSAGGRLGGFSAGTQIKTRLLDLEGIAYR